MDAAAKKVSEIVVVGVDQNPDNFQPIFCLKNALFFFARLLTFVARYLHVLAAYLAFDIPSATSKKRGHMLSSTESEHANVR
jgi:hypothetical protein